MNMPARYEVTQVRKKKQGANSNNGMFLLYSLVATLSLMYWSGRHRKLLINGPDCSSLARNLEDFPINQRCAPTSPTLQHPHSSSPDLNLTIKTLQRARALAGETAFHDFGPT